MRGGRAPEKRTDLPSRRDQRKESLDGKSLPGSRARCIFQTLGGSSEGLSLGGNNPALQKSAVSRGKGVSRGPEKRKGMHAIGMSEKKKSPSGRVPIRRQGIRGALSL